MTNSEREPRVGRLERARAGRCLGGGSLYNSWTWDGVASKRRKGLLNRVNRKFCDAGGVFVSARAGHSGPPAGEGGGADGGEELLFAAAAAFGDGDHLWRVP